LDVAGVGLLLPSFPTRRSSDLPEPALEKLNAALKAGLADKAFQERMAGLGANVLTDRANPEALAAHVNQQVPQWADLLKKSGIQDRKSTRLNSSHVKISYAVFC